MRKSQVLGLPRGFICGVISFVHCSHWWCEHSPCSRPVLGQTWRLEQGEEPWPEFSPECLFQKTVLPHMRVVPLRPAMIRSSFRK